MSSPTRTSECACSMILEIMVGFEVAPVTPQARFVLISSGSTPSSQTLVPVAINDDKDICSSFGNLAKSLCSHGRNGRPRTARHICMTSFFAGGWQPKPHALQCYSAILQRGSTWRIEFDRK